MINPQSQPFGSDPTPLQSVQFSAESPDQPISAGMVLRHARESTGLHIAALAVALKVPVKKLEALEMDRHDLLPDTVFVRALASSVCRTLKVDAAAVLALLPQSAAPLHRHAPVTAPASFSAYPSAARPLSRSSVSGPALLAGLLLLAGALILVFLPTIKEAAASFSDHGLTRDSVLGAITGSPGDSSDASGSAGKAALSAPTGPNIANASAVVDNPPSDAAPNRPSALSLAAATTPPVLPISQALGGVSVPTSASSSPTGQNATADASADRLVTFSAAKQSSWVKVTDAKGAVVLSRTIAPGEAVFAAGALPLSVVVGRADATRVQVRGQVFDLASYSRENVARFEVK